MSATRSSIAYLQSIFGQRRAILDLGEVAEAIGWHPQSIRNGISDGSFPLTSFKIPKDPKPNSPRYFYIEDVAEFLDQRRGIEVASESTA